MHIQVSKYNNLADKGRVPISTIFFQRAEEKTTVMKTNQRERARTSEDSKLNASQNDGQDRSQGRTEG